MATLIPTLEDIALFKVKPEEGELHLLKFLDSHLDESFEVYFNPYMNGDRPDIVLMKKGQGVLIIEVKDYDLQKYELDERKNWKLINQDFIIKSPISQALKYKDNLYNLHIEHLLELKIRDIRNFNMVSCAVYFYKASSTSIYNMIVKPFKFDNNYMNFLKYNIELLGRDNLNALDFDKLLERTYLKTKNPSFLFTNEVYKSFRRFLKPPYHLKEQGIEINYSPKQREIIYESNKKEQRIKGVVGSGKTTVLAARAVQAHIRTNGKVLILTYNITLRNYIKDKVSKVRESFAWENFVISNYHLFINSELNNLGIDVVVPEGFDGYPQEEKEKFFDKHYYSNKQLFIKNKNEIKPYNVILIDEVQDYKREWLEIIKECFLADDGEYVLFGDVKQNIYNNQTTGKDVSTNVKGVTELKNCFRSDFKIKDLAILYQKDIFQDKYELDTFNQKTQNLEFEFERNQQGSINYIHLQNADSIRSLYTIIHENAINKDIPTNDITVLGHSIKLLKKFDAYYRYSSNEKTNTMFESCELVYRMGLNYLKKEMPIWLKECIILLKRNKDKNEKKAFNQLSVLFTLYDLHCEYPDKFEDKLNFFCEKYLTTIPLFLALINKYEKEIDFFRNYYSSNRQSTQVKAIRDNKKIHFHMNSGTIKISTVHSFKGWESETVFLILENFNFTMTLDEVLYTGITRSRSNLVLINNGNQEYHLKLKELIKKVQ